MITLLSERLAPVTSTIGFLQVPLAAAAEALADWRRRLYGSVTVRNVSGDLTTLVGQLEPLVVAANPRELLVETTDTSWTAFFDCGAHGGNASNTVGYLSEAARCHGVVVSSVPHTKGTSLENPGRYGGVQFELFGPVKTEFINYVRALGVAHDGTRWQFYASGTVQDFEQTDAYTSRRVRKRFTSQMLAAYCAALGLYPFDADFYGPEAVVVESALSPPPTAEQLLSLRQAQQLIGIVPGVADQVDG